MPRDGDVVLLVLLRSITHAIVGWYRVLEMEVGFLGATLCIGSSYVPGDHLVCLDLVSNPLSSRTTGQRGHVEVDRRIRQPLAGWGSCLVVTLSMAHEVELHGSGLPVQRTHEVQLSTMLVSPPFAPCLAALARYGHTTTEADIRDIRSYEAFPVATSRCWRFTFGACIPY